MNLSIVVPMYNIENYISQCIESLLNQNLDKNEYEIILIDDGSTDNSFVIAKKYSDKNDNIKLFSQKNLGVSIARNNGIKYSKGKYIYFVDGDDYVALGTLNLIIKCALDNNLDILEFNNIRTKSRHLENSSSKNICINDLKILEGKKYISSRPFNDALWVYFYKRNFLLESELKFYEGRTKQDMIFNAELIPKAKRVAFYSYDVYRYVITPNSITTRKDSKGLRRSIEDFIFITLKYNDLILELENQMVNTDILRNKQQGQLFNIFKGLLESDFKFAEINKITKNLNSQKLYPMPSYKGKNNYRKYLTFIFNNNNLFRLSIWFYRIFKFPIEKIIIKKYKFKKEKKVISLFK